MTNQPAKFPPKADFIPDKWRLAGKLKRLPTWKTRAKIGGRIDRSGGAQTVTNKNRQSNKNTMYSKDL